MIYRKTIKDLKWDSALHPNFVPCGTWFKIDPRHVHDTDTDETFFFNSEYYSIPKEHTRCPRIPLIYLEPATNFERWFDEL